MARTWDAGYSDETKALAARLRRRQAEDVDRLLEYGFNEEEKAEHAQEDAEYLAARRAELESFDRKVEEELAEERIYERMRRRDRAFG